MQSTETKKVTARQEEILNHTLALVHDEGLVGVTIRRVAERVGFSEAALYRHFPSKQELLLALMDRFATRLLEPIRTLASEQERPAIERLLAIVQHHVSMVLESEGLPVLVLGDALASGNKELTERVRRVLGSYLDILENLLEQVPRTSPRPSPKELALLLMGLPTAIAIRSRLLPDPELEALAKDELVRFQVSRLTGLELPPRERE